MHDKSRRDNDCPIRGLSVTDEGPGRLRSINHSFTHHRAQQVRSQRKTHVNVLREEMQLRLRQDGWFCLCRQRLSLPLYLSRLPAPSPDESDVRWKGVRSRVSVSCDLLDDDAVCNIARQPISEVRRLCARRTRIEAMCLMG